MEALTGSRKRGRKGKKEERECRRKKENNEERREGRPKQERNEERKKKEKKTEMNEWIDTQTNALTTKQN